MENLSLEGLTPEQTSELQTRIENFKRQNELNKEHETSKIYEERIYQIYVTEVIPDNGDPGYWPWNKISINVQVDIPVPCANVSPLIIEKIKNGEFTIDSEKGIEGKIEKVFEKSNIIEIANRCGALIYGEKIDDKHIHHDLNMGDSGFIKALQNEVEKAHSSSYVYDDVLSTIIEGGGTHGWKLIK